MPQPYLPGTKNKNPVIYIGLPKWTFKEEDKSKYGSDPKPGKLPFYSTYFNAVELNTTHYIIPSTDQIDKWYRSILNNDFKICPKFHKSITHQGILGLHKIGITKGFIECIKHFKDKLGTSLIQVPETQKPENKLKIIEYLKAIPGDLDASIEVRNVEWFSDSESFTGFIKELNSLNKGIVITDIPGRRDVVHMQLSNSTAYIRFNCRGDHELDMFRIEQWKKQLYSWYLQGLEKCYFFLHIQSQKDEEDFSRFVQQELRF